MKRFLVRTVLMRTVLGASLALTGLATAQGAMAAGLPLNGEMRKLTLPAEQKPVATAEFQDEKGQPTSLEAFRGKVVLLNLWASWCVPCREEMPALDRLQASRGGKDFQVVAVAQDRAGREKVDKFLGEVGAKHIVPYLDASMKSGRAWGAIGLPTSILIDRQGNEVARLIGGAEWDSPDAVKLIDALVAKK
jgi:thiol-disulfide isomerase/thioredoxin